ncbi:hypothetical protein NDU88_005657 [Pleurodeles waltl]|uniref:Uncharacterized protein n=1 Tax=Pleurodeles waltl TaxID=8319 RepID=A0AAV7L1X7_PLEWA|nr:hypothetical protein NDU88_005657 [Pleurodeles waltl]
MSLASRWRKTRDNLPVEPIAGSKEEEETRKLEAEELNTGIPEEEHKKKVKTTEDGANAVEETQKERKDKKIGEQDEEEDARKEEDEDAGVQENEKKDPGGTREQEKDATKEWFEADCWGCARDADNSCHSSGELQPRR